MQDDTLDAAPFISAISAASESLVSLNLELVIIGSSDDDPLYNICSGLEEISRTKNRIQILTIKFYVVVPTEPYGTLSADSWGHLDKVLLTSGWSSLRQVNLGIFHQRGVIEELSEEALEEKRQQRFPGLHLPHSSFSINVDSNRSLNALDTCLHSHYLFPFFALLEMDTFLISLNSFGKYRSTDT